VTGVREIAPAEVSSETRNAASAAVSLAAEDLGFAGVPIVRWFMTAENQTAAGDDVALVALQCSQSIAPTPLSGYTHAPTGTVWLHASLAPKEAALVALHECRHLWQSARWSTDDDDLWERSEEEADSYAFRLALSSRLLT
jgi:hypothetical protein